MRRGVAHLLLAATVVSTVVFVLVPTTAPLVATLLITAATLAHLGLVLSGSTVPLRLVVVGMVLMCAAAVCREPVGTDLWAYHSYGRSVVVYGENPYLTTPGMHPTDPIVERMQGAWVDSPAVYGPVFIGVAVAAAAATGAERTATRLLWQGISAFAVGLSAWLVWRRVGPPGLILFGLNPIVAYQLVHLAHNDALIGLALLGGVLLAERRRWVLAALAFTAAALIKVPLTMVVVLVVVMLLARREVRDAIRVAATSVVVGALAVLASGGLPTVSPMLDRAGDLNKFSWAFLFRGGHRMLLFESATALPSNATSMISAVSIAAVLVVTVVVGVRFADTGEIALPVAAVVVALLACGLYTSAWSFGWLLPVAALCSAGWRSTFVGYAGLFHLATRWVLLATVAVWGGWAGARAYDVVGAVLLLALLVVEVVVLVRVVGTVVRRRVAWRPCRPDTP